jgi:hypothetical protein
LDILYEVSFRNLGCGGKGNTTCACYGEIEHYVVSCAPAIISKMQLSTCSARFYVYLSVNHPTTYSSIGRVRVAWRPSQSPICSVTNSCLRFVQIVKLMQRLRIVCADCSWPSGHRLHQSYVRSGPLRALRIGNSGAPRLSLLKQLQLPDQLHFFGSLAKPDHSLIHRRLVRCGSQAD